MNINKIAESHPVLFSILKHRPIVDIQTFQSCYDVKINTIKEYSQGYVVKELLSLEPFIDYMIEDVGDNPVYIFLINEDDTQGYFMIGADWKKIQELND